MGDDHLTPFASSGEQRPDRCATIYLRHGDILVHSSSRTTAGVWILSEPCTRLDSDCSNEALGNAVRAALQGSRSDVPHPAVWTGLVQPLLKLAKVKSWETFAKGALSASVEEEAGRISLIPSRNLGAKEGFTHDVDAALVVPDTASAEALGEGARIALARGR